MATTLSDTTTAQVSRRQFDRVQLDQEGQQPFILVKIHKNRINFVETDAVETVLEQMTPDSVNWLIIRGTLEADIIRQVITGLNLTPTLVDDMLDETFIAFEGEYEDCFYLEFEALAHHNDPNTFETVHGSFILNRHSLILYEPVVSNLFTHIRRRIITGTTLAQRHGPDYLLYLLIRGAIVDNYRAAFNDFSAQLEDLEELLIESAKNDDVRQSNDIYDRILEVRQQIRPFYGAILDLEEFANAMQDTNMRFVSKEILKYFTKRLYSDASELRNEYQRLRTLVIELLDIHRANINDSINQVIKLLTIISTVFLPLTFIAGVYGMNFEYMPELGWRWSYPIVWVIMIAIGLCILIYAKRSGWFDS